MMRTMMPVLALSMAMLAGTQAKADDAVLREGDQAPDFKAKGDDGHVYALEKMKGEYIVLYFYPKDDTPGCTVEAQGFRDETLKFKKKKVAVLGVSLDDADSHRAFRDKYKLNFPLLVDGAKIAEAYRVPTTGGYAARQTFIIGRDGKLLKIFREVKPKGHAAEILTLLK